MNKVFFTGNLTRDPEVRQTQGGKVRASFGIAVKRGTATDFFNVVAWEHNAEFISKYFSKGKRIIIEGYLKTNNYTDNQGISHSGIDIIADTVEFA